MTETMTTEIVEYGNGSLGLSTVPTWEQAVEQTKTLDKIGRNAAWWIGDWINYMEELFPEQWTQLIPDIGWEQKTLMNWKWVAEHVNKTERVETLSWSLHAEVAGLPPGDQAEWLERAMEGAWTVKQLREEMRGPKKEKVPKTVPVHCPECECDFEWEV